jgi:hypothetical protein
MCVTCDEDDNGDTHIRMQTNSMPSHCYSIPEDSGFQANYHSWDWSVKWNTNVYL